MDNSFHDLEMDVKINSFLRCFIMAMQLISIDGGEKIFSAMLGSFRYTRIN